MSVLLLSGQIWRILFKNNLNFVSFIISMECFSGPEIKLHTQMVWQFFLNCGLNFDPEKFSSVKFFQTTSLLEGEIKHGHGVSGTEVFLLMDLEEMRRTPVWRGLPMYLVSYFLIFLNGRYWGKIWRCLPSFPLFDKWKTG